MYRDDDRGEVVLDRRARDLDGQLRPSRIVQIAVALLQRRVGALNRLAEE